jgi:uncharacterized protein YgiM (DUF1202 family)
MLKLIAIASLTAASLFVGVGSAKADICSEAASRELYTHRAIEVFNYCQYILEVQAQEQARVNEILESNWYVIDANANVRSGASGTSGVMFETTREHSVIVQSWGGENNDWAWINIGNGKGIWGWTHRVNLTKK